MSKTKLKAPMPYFGGKSRVAHLVWELLGNPDNFIEPFAGSAAVLLARPRPPKIETINDADAYLSNFWRATSACPERVAEWADWPVNEADLHARHKWLVLSDEAKEFRRRMRCEPEYFDARVAGWWCWGLCCWIGGGWCQEPKDGCYVWTNTNKGVTAHECRKPNIGGLEGQQGRGVHNKMPHCDRRGVAAAGLSEQLPKLQGYASGCAPEDSGAHLSQQLPLIGDPPRGGHRGAEAEGQGLDVERALFAQVPAGQRTLTGVHTKSRPQLADACDIGRGVHSRGSLGTCAQRRAWLVDWFGRLRDRLRTVRVCCGDWLRVCNSESVTTRLGVTGIFFDPPYGFEAGRDMNLYAVDSGTVAADVRRYCLERGPDRNMRIVLAGYAGEGHEELERHDWGVIEWKAQGGYGNRSQKGKDNAKKERLWYSPHCLTQPTLFD